MAEEDIKKETPQTQQTGPVEIPIVLHEAFHDAPATHGHDAATIGQQNAAEISVPSTTQTQGENAVQPNAVTAAVTSPPTTAPTSTTATAQNENKGRELFPGDDIIPEANMIYDQKRTVKARAEEIFPWLRQLGKDRAGWYLPLRIESMLPKKWQSANQVEPQWQRLHVGERLADYGFSKHDYFTVVEVNEPHIIILKSKRHGIEYTWALMLRELHDSSSDSEPATVVHFRFRGKIAATGFKQKVLVKGGEVVDRLSTMPMLAGLAERCEKTRER